MAIKLPKNKYFQNLTGGPQKEINILKDTVDRLTKENAELKAKLNPSKNERQESKPKPEPTTAVPSEPAVDSTGDITATEGDKEIVNVGDSGSNAKQNGEAGDKPVAKKRGRKKGSGKGK